MKKKTFIIGGTLLILIAFGALFLTTNLFSDKNLISMSGEELLKKLEQKETFIFVVTQDGCHFCDEYKPVLKKVLKDNSITAFELNLTKLKKESEEVRNKVLKDFSVEGTPTTIFINDGLEKTVINRLSNGNETYNHLVESFKDRGFIK